MRVGIIQSSYIPWRGFFDFIDDVDLFMLFDDVKYSHGSWRNRNQVKAGHGLKWLTVPVASGSTSLPIDHVKIGATKHPWQDEHRRILQDVFESATYGNESLSLWEQGFAGEEPMLSVLNERLIRLICDYLGVTTPIVRSRDYEGQGTKTERLVNLLQKVGGTIYLSGPAAMDYLDESMFRESNIGLEFKSYDYPEYSQQFGSFAGDVTVLDLIANCGPQSRDFFKSQKPNIVAIERVHA